MLSKFAKKQIIYIILLNNLRHHTSLIIVNSITSVNCPLLKVLQRVVRSKLGCLHVNTIVNEVFTAIKNITSIWPNENINTVNSFGDNTYWFTLHLYYTREAYTT